MTHAATTVASNTIEIETSVARHHQGESSRGTVSSSQPAGLLAESAAACRLHSASLRARVGPPAPCTTRRLTSGPHGHAATQLPLRPADARPESVVHDGHGAHDGSRDR